VGAFFRVRSSCGNVTRIGIGTIAGYLCDFAPLQACCVVEHACFGPSSDAIACPHPGSPAGWQLRSVRPRQPPSLAFAGSIPGRTENGLDGLRPHWARNPGSAVALLKALVDIENVYGSAEVSAMRKRR
jgi:hypothetical protein